MNLTAAQRDALRYVAGVCHDDPRFPGMVTPRDDVLKRLAGMGLITREVVAYREPNWDRYRFDARHRLTEAAAPILDDLAAEDQNPELYHHNRRAVARRGGRAR